MQLSITLIIIIVTVLVSFAALNNSKLTDDLIFYPPAVSQRNQWYRFITCGFIHADFGHLFFNMLSLYLFGRFVEDGFMQLFGDNGKWLYLLMYLSALVVSLLPTYFKNRNSYSYRSLGASGAVSAVIFAGLMLVPTATIYLYFIPMPGFVFAPLYLLFSMYMERKGRDNVNHSAHLFGSIYGLAFVVVACQLIGYPIVQTAVEEIKSYLQAKGWLG